MKIIETKVYTFDELSDTAKDKARDWYKQGNELPFMQDAMEEYCMELLKDAGMKCDNLKVFYSLASCQGDGAMFTGTVVWKNLTAKIKQTGHYYHAYSKEIDMPEASEREYADFETAYVKICKRLEKYGYDYIDYENSNETVDDNIEANDYTFTESGKRFG